MTLAPIANIGANYLIENSISPRYQDTAGSLAKAGMQYLGGGDPTSALVGAASTLLPEELQGIVNQVMGVYQPASLLAGLSGLGAGFAVPLSMIGLWGAGLYQAKAKSRQRGHTRDTIGNTIREIGNYAQKLSNTDVSKLNTADKYKYYKMVSQVQNAYSQANEAMKRLYGGVEYSGWDNPTKESINAIKSLGVVPEQFKEFKTAKQLYEQGDDSKLRDLKAQYEEKMNTMGRQQFRTSGLMSELGNQIAAEENRLKTWGVSNKSNMDNVYRYLSDVAQKNNYDYNKLTEFILSDPEKVKKIEEQANKYISVKPLTQDQTLRTNVASSNEQALLNAGYTKTATGGWQPPAPQPTLTPAQNTTIAPVTTPTTTIPSTTVPAPQSAPAPLPQPIATTAPVTQTEPVNPAPVASTTYPVKPATVPGFVYLPPSRTGGMRWK